MRIIALLCLMISILSCSNEDSDLKGEQFSGFGNLSLQVRNSDINQSINSTISNTRIFAFNQQSKTYSHELLNVNLGNSALHSLIKTGSWHLALLSAPDKNIWEPLYFNQPFDSMVMYEYRPVIHNNRSIQAPELFSGFADIMDVNEGELVESSVVMSRNVSKVEVNIKKLFGDIDLMSSDNKFFLHNVPNKISYAGNLLPNSINPDTLKAPIFAPIALRETSEGLVCDPVSFIIPGNKSDIDGITPISHRMKLSVQLKRKDGSLYYRQKEIDVSARCNEILKINLTVNALTVDLTTSIHPWLLVPVSPEI